MDRSLDEITGDRQQRNGGNRGRQGRRNNRNDLPRDGVRKPNRGDDSRNIDSEWVHDKYDDRNAHSSNRPERRNYEDERPLNSAKILVENVHYDLTEDELEGLFERIGHVAFLKLVYDRAGRSEGIAYVTYEDPRDAKRAIEEFHGANANGQPIRLRSVPEGPSRGRGGRNQYESGAGRSLADRMTLPRSRSLSPPVRHSDVSKPPPENVDRYVPGDRGDRGDRGDQGDRGDRGDRRRRSRSPLPRRGRDGRRPGARRERGDRNTGRGGEKPARDGRPKKTQEELDAEMDDYFGNGSKQEENDNGTTNEAPVATQEHVQAGDDIEMVE
ncbi:9ab16640-0268-4ed1-8c6f-92f561354b03 [Sclerotinia trifoliorum]|uniref:9ab16640-0268-4ed1-8c6f-92f561354b03 n=1 Tax=Sclerotinia trifoliorum TaxID=28548 RepID=A0A8H2VXF4_9HELO|nr:9ab16640-0268-4ed1-8c6f-92f561354b03 [Sclerotinia trifoliorum]